MFSHHINHHQTDEFLIKARLASIMMTTKKTHTLSRTHRHTFVNMIQMENYHNRYAV